MRNPLRALIMLVCLLGCDTRIFAQQANEAGSTRMVNLSARARIGSSSPHAISGFVVTGAEQEILVRAVGPGLEAYGVADFLRDPVIAVFDAAGVERARNDDWDASDASSFARFGAFALEPGSADAVLVVNLPAGAYTAVVSAADGGAGVALAEVYSSSAEAPLANVSMRAQAGAGDVILIPGLVIADGRGGKSPRRILMRALGRSLEEFGVTGSLADPALSVFDGEGRQLAANGAWSADDEELVKAAIDAAGAFPFSELAVNDAALVYDFPAGNYTLHVAGEGPEAGVALIEAYDITPQEAHVEVALRVNDARVIESTGNAGQFIIERTGSLADLLVVRYTLTGDAAPGVDFVPLPGRVVLPPGVAAETVLVHPFSDSIREAAKELTLAVQPGLGYSVVGADRAAAMVSDGPDAVFVADLRPAGSTVLSLGAGRALLTLDQASSASVTLDLSNLSSDPAGARLELVRSGQPAVILGNLPAGTNAGAAWSVSPASELSPADLVEALMAGRLRITVASNAHPAGELVGYLRPAGRPEPAAGDSPAGPVPPSPRDDDEAVRFLSQATFGPTLAAIAEVRGKTYAQWIDEQMGLPMSSHRAETLADFAAYPQSGRDGGTRPGIGNRAAAWWKIALQGDDQLRQRVAFALSQIFVLSDQTSELGRHQEALAHYYDMLAEHAFGNFRTLLERVTLHPMMGLYLGTLRNAAATSANGPQADENYAREIMQLFTIGLVELEPDGTPRLDVSGQPVATYDQETVKAMARAFTGWSFHRSDPTPEQFRQLPGPGALMDPMVPYPELHDTSAKLIVGGIMLPPGRSAQSDLESVLDALFAHPNTGPFLARRLIQRLVTSNPSPGYVRRVAAVFADNGQGTRGDLAAVVRAVLLDVEARDPRFAQLPGYGKLREPMLRITALLRAFHASHPSGRFAIREGEALAQEPLHAPTVFNFFEPDFKPGGLLEQQGLFAPEFQILDESTTIATANLIRRYIYGTRGDITLDFDAYISDAADAGLLVARLERLLVTGGLSPRNRDHLISALESLPPGTTNLERVRSAVRLIACAPDAAIQR